jgi:hypothetical protein
VYGSEVFGRHGNAEWTCEMMEITFGSWGVLRGSGYKGRYLGGNVCVGRYPGKPLELWCSGIVGWVIVRWF